MKTYRRDSGRYLWLGGLMLLAIAHGCGSGESGPRRYPLAGTANFDGRPIASGEIQFCPDELAGNPGPGSVAEIREGNFRLPARQGILGGKYVLKIVGFESAPVLDAEGELVPGKPLFRNWSANVELPAGGKFDVEVPAAAGQLPSKLTSVRR